MPNINMTSKYRTRDGRAVRILCVDRKTESYPVVALVPEDGQESPQTLTAEGMYYDDGDESRNDLFEVEETVHFCRIYTDGSVSSRYPTHESARGKFSPDLSSVAGIVKITLTDGVPSVEVVETFPQR